MTTGLIILMVGVIAIILTDLWGGNKIWAALATAISLAIYAPGSFGHGLEEALPMSGFLLGVMLLANILQEAGALSELNRLINNKWALATFVFATSVFFDNTVATVLGISLVTVVAGRGQFAGFVAMIALLGGLWSPIGDITSAMTWLSGKMSAEGLISLGPASFLGAIIYTSMCKNMKLRFNAPQAITHENVWIKLAIGLALFVSIPALHHIPLQIGSFHITDPGIVAPLMSLIGWGIMKHLFGVKISIIPHDKGERKAVIKTVSYIFLILMAVGLIHNDLEQVKPSVATMGIISLLVISLIASSHVDNVPWTAILIAVAPFATDSIQWEMLVVVLGLAGGLSPVGSTSTLVASSYLKIGFKDFYIEAPKVLITIAVVLGTVILQNWIFQ